jgi:hypothetical protein
MRIHLDGDVSKVAEFMIRNVSAPKLYQVSQGLSQLAELVWKEYAISRPDGWSEESPACRALELRAYARETGQQNDATARP